MAGDSRFEELAASGVRGIDSYVPGKPVDELEREYGIKDSVKMASNENPLGPPLGAVVALRTAGWQAALYPDGGGYHLKQALAARLSVDPSGITLGNGSNDVLVLLAETFLSPEVEAVYDQYSFVVFRMAVQAAGAVARIAASHPPEAQQPFGHDLAAFQGLINDQTRMVFIANPNNPTGTWLTAGELRSFLKGVPGDVIVVVDEAYGEYAHGADCPDTLEWLADFPNLVVTRTFSKIYGLAGLRVGYAVSDPRVAELLNRVRQPFNVNSIAQVAAVAALEDEEFVARSRHFNHTGMRRLSEGLGALGFATAPSRGNFLLVDMGRPAEPYYEALLRAGIIVRPVANYGLPNHLRITVGLPEQNGKLLEAMAHIVQRSGAGR